MDHEDAVGVSNGGQPVRDDQRGFFFSSRRRHTRFDCDWSSDVLLFRSMALSCNPSLLIADEPTTALDVTIQAQILELMRGLQKRLGMAIMFITHNLGVIAQIADTVAIMYLGQVVEYGPVREILRNPKHPYTVDLLRAVPRLGKTAGQHLVAIEGSIPSPFERPSGCPFHTRCSRMMPGRCEVHMPAVTHLDEGHTVRCLLYEPETSNA